METKVAVCCVHSSEDELVHRDLFTTTSSGFLVEARMIRFHRFRSMLQLAKHLVNSGHTLFGSITHYIAWCATKKRDPWNDETMMTFLNSGRRVPRDIDVFDPFNRVKTTKAGNIQFHKKIKSIESYDLLRTIGVDHEKFEFKKPDELLGDTYIECDVLHNTSVCVNGIDFDVNSLAYDATGLKLLRYVGVSMSIGEMLHEPIEIADVIDAIMRTEATFIGKFEDGVEHRSRRYLLLGRFKKMLLSGFTVKGWRALHTRERVPAPKKTWPVCDNCDESDCDGNDYTEPAVIGPTAACSDCAGELEVGTRQNCCKECGAWLCSTCFWSRLRRNAKKGIFRTCGKCQTLVPIAPETAHK